VVQTPRGSPTSLGVPHPGSRKVEPAPHPGFPTVKPTRKRKHPPSPASVGGDPLSELPEALRYAEELLRPLAALLSDPCRLRALEERRRAARRDPQHPDRHSEWSLSMQITAARRAQGRIANPRPRFNPRLRVTGVRPTARRRGAGRPRGLRSCARSGSSTSDPDLSDSDEPPGEAGRRLTGASTVPIGGWSR
jgi:hypothetical protein